jgi:hypothetical protein
LDVGLMRVYVWHMMGSYPPWCLDCAMIDNRRSKRPRLDTKGRMNLSGGPPDQQLINKQLETTPTRPILKKHRAPPAFDWTHE